MTTHFMLSFYAVRGGSINSGIQIWIGSIKPLEMLLETSLAPKLYYSRSIIFRALKLSKVILIKDFWKNRQFQAGGIFLVVFKTLI